MYLLLSILTPGTAAPLPALTASDSFVTTKGDITLKSFFFKKLVFITEILGCDVEITSLKHSENEICV